MDSEGYLRDLAEAQLRGARLAEAEHRAYATELALAEVHGAADALVAAGAMAKDLASAVVQQVSQPARQELVQAGLTEPVSASAEAGRALEPEDLHPA